MNGKVVYKKEDIVTPEKQAYMIFGMSLDKLADEIAYKLKKERVMQNESKA